MTQSNTPTQPAKRALLKGALAAGAAGLAAAAGGFAYGEKKGRADEKTDAAQHSRQSYPCYGTHQQGITTPHQPFAIMAAFDVSAQTPSQLENLLRTLTARIEFLTRGGELPDGDAKLPPAGSGLLGKTFRPDGLTITVSVGASLFDARFGLADKKPKHLIEMARFPNDKLAAEWCDGDFSIQICALSPETCQNALRDLVKNTAQYAIIRWSIDGFLPKTEPGAAARNLFGFRDGSGNPDVQNPQTANEVLWTGIAANSLD